MTASKPRVAVLSTLYPSPAQPTAGVFIEERMSRVGHHLPVVVVAPVPWFPLQGLIRRWRPHFRPPAPREEIRAGLRIYRPRFLSFPGIGKSLDGLLMALGSLPTLRRIRRRHGLDIIDAHFAYPDGFAARLLGRWLKRPYTVTLRGTEPRLGRTRIRGALIRRALAGAARIFSVSDSLRQWAVTAGAEPRQTEVVGNGVDTGRFRPVPRAHARAALGLSETAPVLITVGGLTERKGFHRVLECLPALRERWPDLQYLIVGGPSAEGDWRERLATQVRELGLTDSVHFLGTVAPDALRIPLSAADVFVLATRNEGWANVLLEALACGVPVVTTDVGGNREVISDPALGRIVPFGDSGALREAINRALTGPWDHDGIRRYAESQAWERRVAQLHAAFCAIAEGGWPKARRQRWREVA